LLTAALLAFGQSLRAGRMYGFGKQFADPNDFALNLCVILPFCIALALSARSRLWKLVWIGAGALTVLAIISTYSRGGFLALAAVILAMIRRFTIKTRTAIFLGIVLAVTVTVIASAGNESPYLNRLRTITDTKADTSGSAQQRWQLFTRSIEITFRHPIFGVGPGQFKTVSGSWHQSHNSYTQLSSEGGIPALIFFVALLSRTFKNAKRFGAGRPRKEEWYWAEAVHCAMVAYVVGAFFLSTAYWLIPYLLVAYGTALRRISEDSSISRVEEGLLIEN
jgi:O-antigen ligase